MGRAMSAVTETDPPHSWVKRIPFYSYNVTKYIFDLIFLTWSAIFRNDSNRGIDNDRSNSLQPKQLQPDYVSSYADRKK